MKMLNVGLIGYGLSGAIFHAPMLDTLPCFKMTHIVSSKKDVILEKYPSVNVLESADSLFQNDEIDVVIITAPNQAHFPLVKKALLSQKHVIVEKPFVVHSKEGNELISIAREKNLVLSVYHNRRWDNGYLTLKNILKENALGKIYLYESYFDRFRPTIQPEKWREKNENGSGILYDLGSHLIDQTLHLFGMPNAICADLQNQREFSQTTDYFHLILEYEKMRVILGSSSIVSIPRPVLSVHGDKGSFVKFGLDPQEEQLKSGMTPSSQHFGIENEDVSAKLMLVNKNSIHSNKTKSIAGSYQAYYEKLYDCIVNKGKNPVDAISALDVIKLIEIAFQSSKSRSWISI